MSVDGRAGARGRPGALGRPARGRRPRCERGPRAQVEGRRRRFLAGATLAAAAALLIAACGRPDDGDGGPPDDPPSGELVLRHFDVGQADATLVRGEDATVLIDAGHWQRDDLVPYLEGAGVGAIDLLVLTHPHADHIGQVVEVLDEFHVSEIWMTGYEYESITFEDTLDAILASDADTREPRAGHQETLGDLHIDVIHPVDPLGHVHDNLAVRLRFGDFAAVYTGDAEARHEGEMIQRGEELRADLLQVGHHGSNTSSGREFLEAVDPDIAVYMAEEDSRFGHPHFEVVSRFRDMGVPLYGTDVSGTVVVRTDGETHEVLGHVENVAAAVPTPGGGRAPTASAGAACVDINDAPPAELEDIVHVGEAYAEEISRLRPFDGVSELDRVSGLGPSRVRDIEEQGLACAP